MRFSKETKQRICKAYAEFNARQVSPRTADDIVCDPELQDRYWDTAFEVEPELRTLPRAAANKCLLNLRKLGEDKGGLPRTK